MRQEIRPSLAFRLSFTIAALGALGAAFACSGTDPSDDGGGGATFGGSSGGSPAAAGTTSGGTPATPLAGAGGSPSAGSSGTPGAQAGANIGGALSAGAPGAGGKSEAGSGGKATDGGAAGSSGGKGGAPSGGAAGTAGAAGASGSGGATGASGAAGAGGGPATGFNPCPPAGMPCKILPLGDSITDGVGVSGGGGYRIELFRLARADQKSITYLGGSMNGPMMVDGAQFPRNHEGHSGWTIEQIDGIVPSPALQTVPHIVLLHIGTNDMYRMPNGAAERLGPLIDQIVMAAPDALVVVSSIIPLPMSASPVMTYNSAVPGVVDARAKAGKHVIFVDQFKGFPTGELADGVHPNQAGYARMAKVWYDAIKAYLR